MKYTVIVLSIFLFTYCSPELENLTISKNRVAAYYEKGTFEKATKQIIDKAIEELQSSDFGSNPAAIFDVDETSLSNYGYVEKHNFGYNYNSWTDWLLEEKSTQIKEVKHLYNWLIERNVKIFFLTGRTANTCAATKNNLINEGYTKFDTLICRSTNEQKISTVEFKSKHRKMIEESGFNIIACVGDQESDFEGGHAGLKIVIPNYLYKLD